MLYAEDHKGRITGSRYNDPGDGNNYPLWCYRLGRGGYISKSDTNGNSPVFACPLIPKKGTGSMPEENKYGMRVWAPDNTQPSIEEDRLLPLSAIETPSDFFLVADSINNSTNIQWYCLTPDGSTVKGIHLRHNNKANAVFADGHVAAKDRDYFAQLHTRQLHNGSTNRNKSFTIYPAR
jgi:prepilin-type processing-associated H-X9-DG protein